MNTINDINKDLGEAGCEVVKWMKLYGNLWRWW